MSDAPRPRRLIELGPKERPPFDAGDLGPEQWSVTRCVRWSLAQLPRDKRILTDTFYQELFVLAPSARAMFAEDIGPQSDRLLGALLAAADGIEEPSRVEASLQRWGVVHRRHHGVSDELYVYVGQALVRTINRLLGNDRTRVHSSWVAVYQWMAAVMIDAADRADEIDRDPRLLLNRTPPASPVHHLDPDRREERVVVPLGPRGARARRRDAG